MARQLLILLVAVTTLYAQRNEQLQNLGREFFAWRIHSQPSTGDDVNRVERPEGWTPDYSPEAVSRYRNAYKEFKTKLITIPATDWTRADRSSR